MFVSVRPGVLDVAQSVSPSFPKLPKRREVKHDKGSGGSRRRNRLYMVGRDTCVQYPVCGQSGLSGLLFLGFSWLGLLGDFAVGALRH